MLGYSYHTGGVAGFGSSRSVAATAFASAPRYHNGGVAGLAPDEVPAILKRGEPVDPGDGSMFRKLFGGDGVTYAPVYNFTGTSAEMEAFRAEAARDRREFDAKVIAAIGKGRTRRLLS